MWQRSGPSGAVQDLAQVAGVPLEVAGLVHRGVFALRPWLTGRRLGVVVAVDAHLPALPGNADQLEVALVNLLVNAATFTPDGGTVTVTARMRGPRVEIAVEDTGAGIPEGEQELRLMLVRSIVDGHGGDLAMRSEQRAGTRVEVTLPVSAAC